VPKQLRPPQDQHHGPQLLPPELPRRLLCRVDAAGGGGSDHACAGPIGKASCKRKRGREGGREEGVERGKGVDAAREGVAVTTHVLQHHPSPFFLHP
jgi:hypothetical protein